MTTWKKITAAGETIEIRFTGAKIEVFRAGKAAPSAMDFTVLSTSRTVLYKNAPTTNPDGVALTHAIGSVLLTGEEFAAIAAIRQPELDSVRAAKTARAEMVARNVPGLELLQSAIESHTRYQHAFTRMMEDEDNDGVRRPAAPTGNLAALRQQYPRAAAWCTAVDYQSSRNDRKSSAGTAARKLIEDGGAIDEAMLILENWLPASAFTD